MDYERIQLMALDLDDTLLHTDSTLSQNTQQAIRTLIDLNIEIVIASGRAFASLPEDVIKIPGLHYAITSNGAAIYRICDGKRIHGVTLSPSAVEAILSVTQDEPVLLEAFINGVAYSDSRYVKDPVKYGCGAIHVNYVRKTRNPVENIRYFLRQNCGKLDSIDIICPQPEMKAYYARKVAQAAPDAYLTTSCRQLLEISDQNAGKAAALRTLCQMKGLTAQQCAAFGNAENDSQMLRFAGLGVAVANATEDCLKAADFITSSNDEDGVAQVLWKIIKEKIKE